VRCFTTLKPPHSFLTILKGTRIPRASRGKNRFARRWAAHPPHGRPTNFMGNPTAKSRAELLRDPYREQKMSGGIRVLENTTKKRGPVVLGPSHLDPNSFSDCSPNNRMEHKMLSTNGSGRRRGSPKGRLPWPSACSSGTFVRATRVAIARGRAERTTCVPGAHNRQGRLSWAPRSSCLASGIMSSLSWRGSCRRVVSVSRRRPNFILDLAIHARSVQARDSRARCPPERKPTLSVQVDSCSEK
jgi:hypothetical protein